MKAYWNGEKCDAEKVFVVVAKAAKPTYWFAEFVGQTRKAVKVGYGGHTFYLDDEDGSGWEKVTVGRGSPDWGHLSLDIEKEVPQPPKEDAQD